MTEEALQAKSLTAMFSTQPNIDNFSDPDHNHKSLSALLPENSYKKMKKMETKIELRTQAAHDLGELLRLKTKQIKKYGHELTFKSSYYRRHQLV